MVLPWLGPFKLSRSKLCARIYVASRMKLCSIATSSLIVEPEYQRIFISVSLDIRHGVLCFANITETVDVTVQRLPSERSAMRISATSPSLARKC